MKGLVSLAVRPVPGVGAEAGATLGAFVYWPLDRGLRWWLRRDLVTARQHRGRRLRAPVVAVA